MKWWYEFGNQDLFTIADKESTKPKVLLDTNIMIKLADGKIEDSYGVHYLLADWINDEVDYYFASEIYNELFRDSNQERADDTRSYLRKFKKAHTNKQQVTELEKDLKSIFTGETENDISDRIQLAECINAEFEYFITLDDDILAKEKIMFEKFGILILNPSEFILMIEKIVNSSTFNTNRLAGAIHNYRKPEPQEIDLILSEFLLNEKGEKKNSLRNLLSVHIGDTENVNINVVKINSIYSALWMSECKGEKLLLKIIRIKSKSLSDSMFMQIVFLTIKLAIDKGLRLVLVEEKYLSDSSQLLLENLGFQFIDGKWTKLILAVVIDSNMLMNHVTSKFEINYLKLIQNKLVNAQSEHYKYRVERHLWPIKFSDINIPTYIVPIRPYWASQLFDYYAAESMIFGAEASLSWNRENIYYRSVKPVSENVPARILWYVSSSKTSGQRSSCIVATSYLDEVIIGRASDIFKQYKAFGIYKWKDINKLCKENPKNNIKALRFSDTEVFKRTVSFKRINEILEKNGKKPNTFACPVEVKNGIFVDIYNETLNE